VPSVTVRVSECGAYHPLGTAGAGYWYDRPDEASFIGYSPVFVVRPRVVVVTPNVAVYGRFEKMMGASVVAVVAEGDGDDGGVVAVGKAVGLLTRFMVDVVVVAPVYAELVRSSSVGGASPWLVELEEWQRRQEQCLGGSAGGLDEVFIIAKPVEALYKIREESWLRRQSSWHLDGVI